MAPTKVLDRGHDRGRVLVDAAVMIADGGEAISDIAALDQMHNTFDIVDGPTRPLAGTADQFGFVECVDGFG